MRSYWTLVFLLFIFTGKAQTADDLKRQLLSHQSDTTKINLLLKIADQYTTVNKDSALYFASQSVALAEQLNYKQGLLSGELKVGDLMVKLVQREESKPHYIKALALARELHLRDKENDALDALGNQYFMTGEYLLAEEYYLTVLERYKTHKDPVKSIRIYTNLGMTYTRLTYYSKAFDALAKSNQISDSVKNYAYVGGNYIDIAVLMGLEKKYEEALHYYDKALATFKEERDSIMMGYANMGKGEVYMQMGNHQKAIEFFKSIEKTLYLEALQFNLHQNLGMSFTAVNRLKEAEQSFLKAQQINEKFTKNFFYSLRNYIEAARLYKKSGRLDEAIDLAHQAERLAEKNGLLANYNECLQLLSSLYEAKGNLSRALSYQKQSGIIADSITRVDQSKKLAEAETRFRLSDKNKEVELLGKENEVRRLRERSDRYIMIALFGGLLLLVIAAAVIARAYKRAREKNDLLAAQKSEIEQASNLISIQAEKLKEADKTKSRFFANISHELRTPVTLITGMLEFIVDSASLPKMKEHAKVALGNSRKLNTIVEEMLDLTRLEANKVALKKKTVQLQPLMNRITGAFSSLLESKNIRFIQDQAYGQSMLVEVDEDKFEKIINNLIYNAIKFTSSSGWIRVNTKLMADDKTVEIQVSDSGIGISEKDLPHIFERFYQVQGDQQNDLQGTGIGLSLVKEFTLLHQGLVSVSSTLGEGTTFTLQFPLVSQDNLNSEINETTDSLALVEFKNTPSILLTEDHEEMRAYIAEVLGNRFNIAAAANGKEALEWLQQHETDLIISDVMMPEMDGYTFLNHLKLNDKLKHIPVIMLTARAAEEDRFQGLRLGVDDYLTKPFHADELRIRVQNVLLNQAARREWLLNAQEPKEAVANDHQREKQFMDEVVAYVEGRIKSPLIAVGDLATHLALSERQLYRKAGELTGLAPAQLIKEIRLKKAYQLLAEGKVSKLSTLATDVGYDNAAYFSRQFTERFGKKPSEFL